MATVSFPQNGTGTGSGMNPWLQALLGGAAGVAGAVPNTSNTNGRTDNTSNTNSAAGFSQFLQNLLQSKTTTSGSSVSNPNLSPGTQSLIDNLTSKFSSLANKDVDLTGYQAQQGDTINRNADLQKQSVQNIMASRGLSASPVTGSALAGVDNSRFSNINNLAQSIPLLKNQLQLTNMQAAGNFMSQIPHGTTTITGGETNENSMNSQNSGGVSNSQGGSSSSSVNQATQKQGGGIGGFLEGIAAILPLLFG